MKRHIGLFERITETANLERALYLALKGKRARQDAIEFVSKMPESLDGVARRIREGEGPIGEFRDFKIRDPKERIISAPCFPDRVLHHAVIGICGPVFDAWLIRQTFACRTGMGLPAALKEAARWSSCRGWYLKLDVRHYFETVPRRLMHQKLERLFGEVELLRLWWQMIDSHRPGSERGMPIGALTSQYLANFYLGFLDRHIKETLRARAYARYMDDMVLWSDDRQELREWLSSIANFASAELGLELKPAEMNRTQHGMDFLGFRFHPGWVGLARSSRRRLRLRLKSFQEGLAAGDFSESEAQDRMTSCLSATLPARCLRYRRQLFANTPCETT